LGPWSQYEIEHQWHDFRAKLDRLYSPIGKPTQLSLEFGDDAATDTGKGLYGLIEVRGLATLYGNA